MSDTKERFTARVVFLEEPRIAEEVTRLALRDGVSAAAEIRLALRDYLMQRKIAERRGEERER